MTDEPDTSDLHNLDKEPSTAEYSHNPSEGVTTESVVHQTPTVTESVSTPIAATEPVKAAPVNTPGVLILQWLTYAFWGWTLVALYWLVSATVGYLVNLNSDNSSSSSDSYYDISSLLAYPLAAVIVLFIISLVCDIFYRRSEPLHKTGAAMVIMVIHVVIFALAGIGSLIVGVFALVNMLISTDANEVAVTTMITAGIMTVAYGVTLLRTFRPSRLDKIAVVYWLFMGALTIAAVAASALGPIAHAQLTKNDRRIESGLDGVASAVADYTKDHQKLPSSLTDVKVDSYQTDSSQLIKDGVVEYTAKERVDSASANKSDPTTEGASMMTPSYAADDPVYHYELCVNYKVAKNSTYSDINSSSRDQRYPTNPKTSSHPAGKVCYDLQTDYIYSAY
jgi:hypothetical protein